MRPKRLREAASLPIRISGLRQIGRRAVVTGGHTFLCHSRQNPDEQKLIPTGVPTSLSTFDQFVQKTELAAKVRP